MPAEPGLSVGNSPEAFPPGLRLLDPLLLRNGRLPTPRVELTPGATGGTVVVGGTLPLPTGGGEDEAGGVGVADLLEAGFGLAGAVTDTEADAAGSAVRGVVDLPVTVSFTDFTAVAELGTVTSAGSWRVVEPESTAPRSHVAVPLPVPHPRVNVADWLDGATDRRRVTPGMLPFLAETSTVHSAEWPRVMLACWRATLTHSSAGPGVDAAGFMKASSEAALVVLADADGLAVLVAVAVAAAVLVAVAVSVGVGVGVFVGVAALVVGLFVAVGVGVGVLVGLAVEGCVFDGVALGVAVEVLVPVPVEELVDEGVGVGVGVEVACCTGSHTGLIVDSRAAKCACTAPGSAVWPPSMAVTTPKLVAETTRKPPAARLTAGRTCAKRMKALPLPFVARSSMSAYIRPVMPGLDFPSVFDTKPEITRRTGTTL